MAGIVVISLLSFALGIGIMTFPAWGVQNGNQFTIALCAIFGLIWAVCSVVWPIKAIVSERKKGDKTK